MLRIIIFAVIIAIITIFLYTKLSNKDQHKVEKSIDNVAKELKTLKTLN